MFADFLAPHNPVVGDLRLRYMPPVWMPGGSADYLLGTDALGRDVLSRLIFGARVSLVVGFFAVGVAGLVGTLVGVVSGFIGGWLDQVMMRLTDAWLALPGLVIAIFLVAVLGPGVSNLIIVLALVYWTRYARVIRSEVLSLRERDFVSLATIAGCSKTKIMLRHIVPNVLNTAVVMATLLLGMVIIAEASLSFLGLGVPPPQPAWGSMLSGAMPDLMTGRWWLTVFPGMAITLMVLSANMLGDWLRVRFDPQLRQS